MDFVVAVPILRVLGCTDEDLQHVIDGMVYIDENNRVKCRLCNSCIDGPDGHLRGKMHQRRLSWERQDIRLRAACCPESSQGQEASKGSCGKGIFDKGKGNNSFDEGQGKRGNNWFDKGKDKNGQGKGDKDKGQGKRGKGDKGDKDKGKDKNWFDKGQGKGDKDNDWFYNGKGKPSDDDVNWPPPSAFEPSSSSASYSSWDRINLDDDPNRHWQ